MNASPTATLDHFAISTISSPKTAGTAITGITLTAQDIGNNTVTGFTGTVAYSGTAGITGTSAEFASGQLTSVSVTPITSGSGKTFIVTGSTKTGTATFDIDPGAVSAAHSTISPATATKTADGSSTQTITLQARDVNNNNRSAGGDTILWSATAGTFSSQIDGGNGMYTVVWTSPTSVGSGSATVTATLGGTSVGTAVSASSSVITLIPGTVDAAHSTISPATASITANGTSTRVITVQARDANNNNLTAGGSTVVISKSSGTGTIGSTTDNGNGTYTATVTAPVVTGSGTFTATLGGSAVTGSAVITYTPGTANKLVMKTAPSSSVTAGAAFGTLPAVYVEDSYGNVVTGDNSTVVTATVGTGTGPFTGTLSATASGGTATFSGLGAPTLAQSGLKLTFTGSGLTSAVDTTSITVTAAAASKLVFVTGAVASTVGAASGTITVQRRDAYDNPNTTDAPRTVTLASDSSGVVSFTPAGPLTIGNGASTVSFTYTDSHAGTPTITAASTAPTTLTPCTQQETVGKADQTISFTLASPVANTDGPLTLSATASSGLTVSFSSSDPALASVSGTALSIHQAGTVTVTASQAGDDNCNAATPVARTLIITGVGAGADAVSRQANSTGIKIPVASLLANDSVVDTAGQMSQTNLTLSGVTSGTGNTVTRSGAYVLYKPTTPTDNTVPLSFTYTATDGTSSSTATVTVSTVGTAPPPFTLDLIRVVSGPTFSGGNTRVTVEFGGVPNQTYMIEYSTDMAVWSGEAGVSTGTTGTFEATFEAPGDHTATGDASWSNMYFRSTR